MIDDQVREHRFEPGDLWASIVDICLVEFIMAYMEVLQFFHLAYEEISGKLGA